MIWVLIVFGSSLVITLAFQFIIWFDHKQHSRDKEINKDE